MKIFIILTAFISFVSSSTLTAQPPGKAHSGNDFRGVIHSLFDGHDQFDRSVELMDDGYRARTTSGDPEMASLLQKHVAQMEERLDGGMSVRHWDPAFAELREHYNEMEVKLENVDQGVSVTVTGKTPEAVKVAHNHAKIVSGFVTKGGSQMHAEHPAALGAEGDTEAVGESESDASCKSCQKGEKQCPAEKCSEQCGKGDKPCCAGKEGAGTETSKTE